MPRSRLRNAISRVFWAIIPSTRDKIEEHPSYKKLKKAGRHAIEDVPEEELIGVDDPSNGVDFGGLLYSCLEQHHLLQGQISEAKETGVEDASSKDKKTAVASSLDELPIDLKVEIMKWLPQKDDLFAIADTSQAFRSAYRHYSSSKLLQKPERSYNIMDNKIFLLYLWVKALIDRQDNRLACKWSIESLLLQLQKLNDFKDTTDLAFFQRLLLGDQNWWNKYCADGDPWSKSSLDIERRRYQDIIEEFTMDFEAWWKVKGSREGSYTYADESTMSFSEDERDSMGRRFEGKNLRLLFLLGVFTCTILRVNEPKVDGEKPWTWVPRDKWEGLVLSVLQANIPELPRSVRYHQLLKMMEVYWRHKGAVRPESNPEHSSKADVRMVKVIRSSSF